MIRFSKLPPDVQERIIKRDLDAQNALERARRARRAEERKRRNEFTRKRRA